MHTRLWPVVVLKCLLQVAPQPVWAPFGHNFAMSKTPPQMSRTFARLLPKFLLMATSLSPGGAPRATAAGIGGIGYLEDAAGRTTGIGIGIGTDTDTDTRAPFPSPSSDTAGTGTGTGTAKTKESRKRMVVLRLCAFCGGRHIARTKQQKRNSKNETFVEADRK